MRQENYGAPGGPGPFGSTVATPWTCISHQFYSFSCYCVAAPVVAVETATAVVLALCTGGRGKL